MNTKNLILIVIIVAVVVLGGYFLLGGGYQAPAPAPAAPAPTAPEITAPEEIPEVTIPGEVPPSTPEVREITVNGTEFSFDPASITVSAGEKVKVTFRNDGTVVHDFKITELGIGTKRLSPGQTETIEFTAPASGTYSFFCSVPGHRPAGMEGDFRVQ